MLNTKRTKISLFAGTVLFLSSCDALKKVDEGDYLLSENNIEVDGRELNNRSTHNRLVTQPNNTVLGLPLGLYVYNLANETPDSTHVRWLNKNPKREERLTMLFSAKQLEAIRQARIKRNNWLKRMGEAPAVIREEDNEESAARLKKHYHNLGWFNTDVQYNVAEEENRRASVSYDVSRVKPYHIGKIDRQFASPVVDSIFGESESYSQIKSGRQYRLSDFEAERERLTVQLRNSGLYNFNKDYVTFVIDTNDTGHRADVEYMVSNRPVTVGDTVIYEPFKVHRISKVNITTDHTYANIGRPITDSVEYNGINLYSHNRMKYNPKAITKAVFIEPDSIYRDVDHNLTTNHLSELRAFKYPNIRYRRDPADSTGTNLIADIQLTPHKKFNMNPEIDASTSQIQQFGIGFSYSLLIRNVFKGAETLQLSARGSIGSSSAVRERDPEFFNVVEYGADANLSFPRILFPIKTEGVIPRHMMPRTNVRLGFGSQQNIGLDKRTSTAVWNYRWRPTRIHSLSLDLFNAEYVDNRNIGNYFNIYRSSYGRLNELALDNAENINPEYFDYDEFGNPTGLDIPDGADALLGEYEEIVGFDFDEYGVMRNILNQKNRLTENNLILATNLTWVRDSRRGLLDNQFSRLRIKLESAGSILRGISSIADLERNEDGRFEVLGVAYSQYIKPEVEYVRYWKVSRRSVLAFRTFGGIAIPFSNSDNIPFTRSYFAGGPNDNRGWRPFRLGPGSNDRQDEFNEANLKLAFNIEYRHGIVGDLKGALFVDAGNIWYVNYDITDEPSTFTDLGDLQDIAVASGFGIRYDFSFFVIRGDFGFKTYNPAHPTGDRWFKEYNFKNSVFNIGVNYPF